jgi:hypothetical protein
MSACGELVGMSRRVAIEHLRLSMFEVFSLMHVDGDTQSPRRTGMLNCYHDQWRPGSPRCAGEGERLGFPRPRRALGGADAGVSDGLSSGHVLLC